MGLGFEERTHCEVCGAADRRALFAPGPRARGSWEGIVRCGRCGLVYRSIRRGEAALEQHYGQSDFAELSEEWIAGRTRVFAGHLEILERFRAANRVLDVGAGPGFFLSACAARGWECYGVDISRRAADFARARFGLNVSCASLEQARYPPGFFDVVTFWNVLDELPSPRAALQEAHRVLRPGGGVLVRVPNAAFHVRVRSLLRGCRLAGVFGGGDPTTIHLFSFAPEHLKRLLQECGFTRVAMAGAALSWTTRRDAREGSGRRVFARLVQQFSALVFWLSRGRWLVSPSVFSSAEKKRCVDDQAGSHEGSDQ
jgi:SAM-dependent methyltransferase